jgi:phosphoenolpyruvate-protein phosphotransferase (PTS system enzyme I)
MHTDKVLGFATEQGGETSHTVIMARSLGIPAVVGLRTVVDDLSGGDTVIIDGSEGIVIISPDEVTLRRYQEKRQAYADSSDDLDTLIRLPAVTRDGHEVQLFANIEFPREIELVRRYNGAGVGLFRTEFLFVEGSELPGERAHIEAYKQAVRLLEGRPLVIRTLDFGADKLMVDTGASKESNPFLGFRSIRFCFDRLDLFKPQLRAILRASAMGQVKILFPMISSLDELLRAKSILREVMEELDGEGISYDEKIPVGIMVEIPSAVAIADILAAEVDFFSIGTNDLIQYTLAVDRVNERVAALYQPAHPAVLRSIKRVIDVGRETGRDVALCGEMSGNPLFTALLVGLGLEEFSVTPTVITEIKRVIRAITLEDARAVAEKAMRLSTAEDVVRCLQEQMQEMIPDIFGGRGRGRKAS